MTVKILTDSGSDLPLQFFNDGNVTLIPLVVNLDGQAYEDLTSIQPKEVYDAMRNGKAPTTSQVSPARFKELFTNLAKENQPAIYIAFSSELSGTYQTAVMMKTEVEEEFQNLDLTIIDTKCASLGEGLVVKAAAELAAKGGTKEEIIELVKFYSTHMEHIFTVDNLEYLARGGRISKASAFVGGLLNIKPILNVEDGKLIPLEKIRGKKKVNKRILEIMEERGVDLSKQTIGISHGDVEDEALELKRLFEEKFGCKSVYINYVGAVIGSHSGPGTIAIFFLNKLPSN
ncbi:DegV family protein [Ferdinandcohnia quinoae]|uniref:DegV family protein n=1 Tax=Fredinandcohnia quinoae TaxID=2918902 RepID=A0AAW5E740_9BACI|nr:DegV family protein [Fredinandcohnia sp. SECRCQ15]MCH1625842.1 DegV family protein [Fredinandcohnia sp. SECRCQ15]